MTHLVDTDWVADYLKGREPALRLFESLPTDGIAISIVTYSEIYEGVYSSTMAPIRYGTKPCSGSSSRVCA